MVFPKNDRSITTTAVLLLSIVFWSSCKKLDTKDPIVYDITAVMPHDDTPVPGVKYRIVEYKYKTKFGKPFGDHIPTGWELTGVTDSQGKASGSFEGVLKTNYDYYIYFDYNDIQLPQGMSNIEVIGPEYDYLARSNPADNVYKIRVLPYMPVQFNFKNTACIDQNDTFRYKYNNMDENLHFVFYESTPWLEGASLNGCVDMAAGYSNRLAGHYVFKWEAIRGGTLSEGIDTFYVAPGANDNIHMEW